MKEKEMMQKKDHVTLFSHSTPIRLHFVIAFLMSLIVMFSANTIFAQDENIQKYHCRIVDYGADMGNGYYRNMNWSKTGTDIEMDVDGDGQTSDDSVAMWPYIPDQPISPSGADYDLEAPNAVFYGGMVAYHANRKNGRLTEGMLNQNHELRDDFNFMGSANKPDQAIRAYGLYYWKKEDFLNGGDQYRVRFDESSSFGVHISRYWNGFEESRGLVRDNDQFYISEATQEGVHKSHVFYPTKTRWAKYDPVPPHQIGFDPEKMDFKAHDFENVTAIGFVLARHKLERGSLGLKWHAFEAYASVQRPAAPSYHIAMESVDEGLARMDSGQVQVPSFFAAKTEVSYAIWQKFHRWAVSNQYLFDLGRPGYIFTYDGDMGSMALCNATYGADHPATGMTWLDAVAWCNALSEYEGLTPCYYHDEGFKEVFRKTRERARPNLYDWKPEVHIKWDADGFRLPTPAEWHRAAMADQTKLNFPQASGQQTHPVGSNPPNALGIQDAAGNVWEYTWDTPDTFFDGARHSSHTVLGGDFRYPANPMTNPLIPYGEKPWLGHYSIGFRPVRRRPGTAVPPLAKAPPTNATANMESPVPIWTIEENQAIIPSGNLQKPEVKPEMVEIPDGSYLRKDEAKVAVSPFFISQTEIPFTLFRRVAQWATMNGYNLDGDGDMGSMDLENRTIQT